MQPATSDDLRPQPPGGLGRGAVLALLVHGLLIVGLAVGVNWRTHEPEGVSAELWAAVPQSAAPPAVEPPPTPQPAPPQPTPPQPQPRAVEPPPQQPDRDAEIAIEKAREEKKRKEDQDRQREQERHAKAQKEREDREREAKEQAAKDKQQQLAKEREAQEKEAKAKAERDKQQLAEEQKRKKAEDARMAQIREENLKRMQGMMGGTGAPGSTGTAQQSAGPSASYGGRIIARVRPNIVFTDDVPGNPEAVVEVRAAPDGSIVGRRLVQSSGVKSWDDAVLRAIDRTETLPRDTDGRVPSAITIVFKRN